MFLVLTNPWDIKAFCSACVGLFSVFLCVHAHTHCISYIVDQERKNQRSTSGHTQCRWVLVPVPACGAPYFLHSELRPKASPVFKAERPSDGYHPLLQENIRRAIPPFERISFRCSAVLPSQFHSAKSISCEGSPPKNESHPQQYP